MRNLARTALAASFAFAALGSIAITPASAQTVQRVPSGLEGTGGSGGTGGGVAGARGTAPEVARSNRNSPYVAHVRTTTPPPMDPSRRIVEVDCTRPFNFEGRGNLRCM